MPDPVRCLDGTARDSVCAAPAQFDHHPRVRDGSRGRQAPPGSPTPLMAGCSGRWELPSAARTSRATPAEHPGVPVGIFCRRSGCLASPGQGEYLMTVRRNAPRGSSSAATGPQCNADASRSVAARLHINQRTLQCALGVVWIVDGLLKFQPHLFKSSFVSDVISPMAAGQPGVVASTINHTATLLSHGTTAWVALFGVIEIAIGVGLFFRRLVKPALIARSSGAPASTSSARGSAWSSPGRRPLCRERPVRCASTCFSASWCGPGPTRRTSASERVPHLPPPAGASSAQPVRCSCGPPSGSSKPSSGCSPSTAVRAPSRIN